MCKLWSVLSIAVLLLQSGMSEIRAREFIGQEIKLTSEQKTEVSRAISDILDNPGAVHDMSVQKIKRIGRAAALEVSTEIRNKQRDPKERRMLFKVVEDIGDDSTTDDLMKVAEDNKDDEYIRMLATRTVYMIGRENDINAFNSLKRLARQEKSEGLRRDFVMATGKVGQKNAISYLSGVIDGNDTDKVKASAIYGLGKIKDPAIEDILIEKLDKDNSSLTMEYARVLGRVKKSKKAVPVLLKKLNSLKNVKVKEDVFVNSKRMVLFEILGDLGDTGVIDDIRAYVDDEDINIAEDSAICLVQLGDTHSIKKVIERAKIEGGVYTVKRLKARFKKITGQEYVD